MMRYVLNETPERTNGRLHGDHRSTPNPFGAPIPILWVFSRTERAPGAQVIYTMATPSHFSAAPVKAC